MEELSICLLFPDGAKPAVDFYLSVFPGSELLGEDHWPDGRHLASNIRLHGSKFVLVSGGPECTFSMATSHMIECDTQEEVDMYWERLMDGGEAQACGWLTDRFGVSWQVQWSGFSTRMAGGKQEQRTAMFEALMEMVKIDVAALEKAYDEAGS